MTTPSSTPAAAPSAAANPATAKPNPSTPAAAPAAPAPVIPADLQGIYELTVGGKLITPSLVKNVIVELAARRAMVATLTAQNAQLMAEIAAIRAAMSAPIGELPVAVAPAPAAAAAPNLTAGS